ncbi:PREDICTED: uncharacterized protein LOC109585894 [Amphimedon queenslandica]|uniref:Uncharacterized protein n=2 Tax=Amphimedon queenslandica TaxID=400682 RepID=A0AAN0JKQ8_AMPQE|nr:PREDICTED: uncharacterized protein LOC109585894 [Amphimedon queenslandica]|eukprot:XP_019857598.1 PREDICTED: uncharacterized protein LOC109585894 [Amphimedon queenslandica]
MYGGIATDGGGDISTNSIYLFQLSNCTINWECLNQGSVPNDGLWPKGRDFHDSTIINGVSTSPTLVMIGGVDSWNQPLNECLLLDTSQYNWMKIPLPESVNGRYAHTVSSFVVDPNHVFLIIVGGCTEAELKHVGGGVINRFNKPVTDPNITMVVELVFNDGQWSVGPVLDSFNIPLLYELILKERRKESYMIDKVKELQVINESLHHDLQVSRTNNQSLQEALLALESDNIKKLKTDESVEEKQIMTDEDIEKLRATVEAFIAEIEEKKQVEDLKTKVADNERYTAKLMKEKEQLQERVTSLEEQSIKKTTSTKEVQFDYMIPSMGGQFKFPRNTVLVSAVYAVSLSKPLLKRLKLEIQHCIDLRGRPDLAQYLKFAIAPMSTSSLPYQFSIVEGGEFSSNSGYGSIHRNKFCLVCILGEEWTNGDTEEREEEEQQPQQEENEEEEGDKEGGEGSDSDDDDTSSTPPGASGACKESTKETNLPTNTVSVAGPATTPNTDHVNKAQSTGVKRAVTYAGLVYYEEKRVEDLVTFTAAKNLEALIQYIERKHSQAEIGPDISFSFKFPYDYVELNFDAPQKKPFTGWTLTPHTDPCRLYQEAIDKFGDKEHSRPSCCLISVYGSPDAVPFLNYFIPLEGVAHPVSLNIHRVRRNFTVPVHPSTNSTTSSYNVVHESTTLSTGGANAPSSSGSDGTIPVPTKRREGGFDIKTAKQKIKQVMIENHSDFAGLLQFSLVHVANKLFEVHMIPPEVQQSPTYDAISTCFLSMMNLLDSKSDLEKHCVKYLEALSSVGGPIEFAANLLRKKWTTALEGALEFEQSVKRVRTNDE